MTVQERERLRLAMSRANERAQIREAIAAGAVAGSIDLLLGNELIAAAKNTVHEWELLHINERSNRFRAVAMAIDRLRHLVG